MENDPIDTSIQARQGVSEPVMSEQDAKKFKLPLVKPLKPKVSKEEIVDLLPKAPPAKKQEPAKPVDKKAADAPK